MSKNKQILLMVLEKYGDVSPIWQEADETSLLTMLVNEIAWADFEANGVNCFNQGIMEALEQIMSGGE